MSFWSDLGHWITGNLPAAIAAAGLLVTIATWLIDHRRKRRRVSYRVHMNSSIGATSDMRTLGDFVVRSQKDNQEVPDPSLVLIRVSNTGSMDVTEDHFAATIRFDFGSRVVKTFEVFEVDPPALGDTLQPGSTATLTRPGVTFDQHLLKIPPLVLNTGDRFKLLVLLSGAGDVVTGSAQIKGGKFVPDNRGDSLSRRTTIYGAVCLVLVGALAAFLVSTSALTANEKIAVQCVPGAITIAGSTAFETAMTEIAHDYEGACHGATVTVIGGGSVAGINELVGRSVDAAMYDGTVDHNAYPTVRGIPVAVVVFTVVVNSETGVHSLTAGQLQGIYSLRYTNWVQVGGNRLPITIVARDSQSGTRDTFKYTVLGGRDEHGPTSQNCTTPDPGQSAPVMICEMNSTQSLLQHVNNIPGAIGYAELAESALYPNIGRVQIDGHDADIQQDPQSRYPFRAPEHIYTYGPAAGGSLLSAFLGYLNSDTAKHVMEKDGDIPCGDLIAGRRHTLCGD